MHEIKGIPSPDLLVLPDSGKLIMSIDTLGDKDNFYPDDRIALIDLKKNEVEKVISVGRGSVKVGHFIANLTLTVGLAMASGYAAYSAGSPAYIYPVFGVRGGKSVAARMVASGDGKRVYVLNPGTKDITVIDTGTGEVLSMMPVGGGCSRVISTPKDRFAGVVCDEHVAMIDTQSSEVRLDHRLKNGKVLDAGIDESGRQVIVLTSGSLLVFALDDASLIKEIEGFGKPHLLIRTP